MLSLAQSALGPLRGVVVRVDETGDEELGGGEAVEGGGCVAGGVLVVDLCCEVRVILTRGFEHLQGSHPCEMK